MDEIIEVEDRFYILAGSSLSDQRMLVLKQGETFAVFNGFGDIGGAGHTEHGLFADGMRHLSRLQTRIQGRRPLLLSSTVTRDNTRLAVDLTNPDIAEEGRRALPRGTLHVSRGMYLWERTCYERLALSNFSDREVEVEVSLHFAADFADIFEVRGMRRERRGEVLEPRVDGGAVVLAYRGADGVERRTRIDCTPAPAVLERSLLRVRARLGPGEQARWCVRIVCEPPARPALRSYNQSLMRLSRKARAYRSRECEVKSTNDHLDEWVGRSLADVRMLLTPTEHGEYPDAGIPWYSTPFGRDGIITALELLWVNPSVARGVLRFLAATQSQELDPSRDAEPGKILHEWRTNEMAATGEVPFGRYYGTVDATPLFVVLAGEYYEQTGELALIESLWPSIERALEWIDAYGDLDGDGLVEYERRSATGLDNQGWKDSHDSVFHADGATPRGPIALCEVQGYAYDAKRHAARLARALGRGERADRLLEGAEALRRRFEEAFWCERLGTYALALDGAKEPCAVRTSNPGHCLFSGICDPDRAARVAQDLLSPPMYTGWGIRTLGNDAARYNPMSYHNGSVWPHDNAIAAAGLARYDLTAGALKVFRGWLDASTYFELHRLPELCCGFRRRRGKGPTLYPVACSPQAWAAGAVFMMLGACLGLRIDGVRGVVSLRRPHLPRGVDELRIRRLRVGEGRVDLLLRREGERVGVAVLDREGPVETVVVM